MRCLAVWVQSRLCSHCSVRCKAGCTSTSRLGGTHHTPCRRPLPDYYGLALADWLAQAEIKLDKGGEGPMLADTGGTDVWINWAAGHGDGRGTTGQSRAGQGLEMHWTEVALPVTNRCSPLPMLSRRACHAVHAHLPCTQYGEWTEPAQQRTHVQVKLERDRLPETSGWTAPGGLGSCCMEATWVVCRNF